MPEAGMRHTQYYDAGNPTQATRARVSQILTAGLHLTSDMSPDDSSISIARLPTPKKGRTRARPSSPWSAGGIIVRASCRQCIPERLSTASHATKDTLRMLPTAVYLSGYTLLSIVQIVVSASFRRVTGKLPLRALEPSAEHVQAPRIELGTFRVLGERHNH